MSGLGFIDGQPFPHCWPSSRPKVLPESCPSKTLEQAFAWPSVVKRNLTKVLDQLGPGDGTPLISTGKCLKASSHFSGICTQSRAAMVLQEHQMGVSFSHVKGSAVCVYHCHVLTSLVYNRVSVTMT